MGQRTKDYTRILGFTGWAVDKLSFELPDRRIIDSPQSLVVPGETGLVFTMKPVWKARCSMCFGICEKLHQTGEARRWRDLPWAGRRCEIEYSPRTFWCEKCQEHRVECLAWAEPYQRSTRRLQQAIALDCSSQPIVHVAAKYAMSWHAVRNAETHALARWDATRERPKLRLVGVDEKWLGRRHTRDYKFLTIVSDLETGEPIWIGPGRSEQTLAAWLATLTEQQKADIVLFAMDMHKAFENAVRADEHLAHVAIVHDPFHIIKRANQSIDELRRETFFRANSEMRRIGRGKRWLFLRSWENSTDNQKAELTELFRHNGQLARACQIVEELRAVLHAPDRDAMTVGLNRVLRRTQSRANKQLRGLHDSLINHRDAILALGEHRPPVGRIEALNNNWEAIIRMARGIRDYDALLLRLRFRVANPIRTERMILRFLALDLPIPTRPLPMSTLEAA